MIAEDKIEETLLQAAVNRSPGSPALEVALPFQSFSSEEAYLEAVFLPNVTQEIGVANNAKKLYQGFLQLSVMFPDTDLGALPARTIASEVVENWKKGTILDGSGFRIRITRVPSIAQAIKDGAWIRVPVSVPYQVIA